MQKVAAVNIAAEFKPQEMFYSETDRKGIIRDGNDVFTRISEYPIEALMGSPHNIVRHPDMPKTIFRYFWSCLKAGEPIAAYVKNMTATGRYYWVLASVFAHGDGFISIRVKPTSDLLPKVEALYARLLQFEKTASIEEADKKLFQEIRDLGFPDYRYFAIEAVTRELDSRRNHMVELGLAKANAFSPSLELSKDIYQQTVRILDAKDRIAGKASVVGASYKLIKFVGINMMSEVEKLGKDAATISVVAQTFEAWAQEVYVASLKMTETIQDMATLINQASFVLAGSRFQIEMSEFESERNANAETLRKFLNLGRDAMVSIEGLVDAIIGKCHQVEHDLSALGEALSALNIIYQNGMIEVARLPVESYETVKQLESMRSFVETIRSTSQSIHEDKNEIRDRLSVILDDDEVILKEIDQVLRNYAPKTAI